MLSKSTTLYEQAVEISTAYLGPAGERFIRRQISTHIGVPPEKLHEDHVPQLVNWVGLTFAMLTHNKQEVEGFTTSLMSLQNNE